MKSKTARAMRGIAAIVFVIVMLSSIASLRAQEARGTITGKVRDTSNAVVPGASVKVINAARGTTVALTSNDVGIFQALYILPGTYRIQVEAQGFKKYVRDNVTLRIGETLDLDVELEVGSVDQTVTVTAESPALETATASMGQTVDSKRIAELPLVHGDPYTLIGLSGGASFARDPRLDRPFEPTHIVGYVVNGTRANRSDLTIDGVTSTATANANEVTASYVPPTDIVQEFKVQTTTFDSQFGNTEGGVTSISIKSGTNSLHGTAYFWGEPGSLAANDFFGNSTGKARPDSFSNRWGGSLGGPVYIPKLYNGKNKTFFLWGYERISDARPRNNGTPTVPTQKMKNGDFSELLAYGERVKAKPTDANPYQIYNPFTRRLQSNGSYLEDPFPGNIIPQNLINPVAKSLLQYFPDPLTPCVNDCQNNFQQPNLQERATYYTNTIRIDHVVSDKQRIFGRTSWYDRDSTYNNYFNNLATGTLFQFLSRQAAIDDVYTFNATTVLNLRYGYNRFIRNDFYNPANRGFDLTSVGFPASYNNLIPADRRTFPRLDISGYQGTNFNSEPRPIDTHSFVATLNKTLGSHGLKGGAEYRIYRENSIILVNDVTGRFNFDATYTRGPSSTSPTAPSNLGQSFAAFLLGIPSPTNSYITRPADYAEQSRTWGFFIQDDWKVNSRLTLNIGLRYEFETPLTERYNRSVRGFDPNYVQPFEAQVQANYAKNPTPEVPVSQFLTRGGLTFAGVNGQSEGLYATTKNNFMPRFGVAFKLNEKTVFRGGYGIFFGFLGQRRGDVIQSGFSQTTNVVPTVDGVNFVGTLSNPFPNGLLEPVGASQGPQTFLGQSITFFNTKPLTPYNQRWELGFQRELPGGWVAEAAYVGNRGTHIELFRNLNVTPQRYLSKSRTYDDATTKYLQATVPNPFFGVLPRTSAIGSTANIARERLLRPFPQFDAVTTTANDGYSWYHGLQLRIEKRFSKGYTLQASYTFSKFMQATELLNQDDVRPVEVISDSDYPHRLAVSGIYELPFGKGQRFLGGSNGVVSRIAGGWQVQGVYTYQSGPPLSWGNAVLNGDINDVRLPGDQQTPQRWINTSGFVTAAASQPNDYNIRTFPLRFGFIRGDNNNNFDLSVVKNTNLTEGMRLQFRAEFINAFNHVWFPSGGVPLSASGIVNNARPNPQGVQGVSTAGVVTFPSSAAFGSIGGASNQANYPRRVQLGLKLIF